MNGRRGSIARMARLTLVALLVFGLLPVVADAAPLASAATQVAPGGRDFFPVPDAALVRPLGDIVHGACPVDIESQSCNGVTDPRPLGFANGLPMVVPGLGIPLGGVGAGSFMINQAGTFGPWNMGGQQDGDRYENRILPQAAFHVREQLAGEPATVRTLATKGPNNVGVTGLPVPERSWGSPLPAWNVLQPGEGSTAALYPFGWTSYTPFAADVSMQYFSPIVAREERRTSLPVAYFDIRLANHTNKTDAVSVMFTMPNAPAHVGRTPASVRTGLSSRFQTDPVTGVKAVTLSADDPTNTPDAAKSEWTIAAKPGPGQDVSYTTSWNGGGDGSDVYAPFTQSGSLPDSAMDNSASAGAISVSATLAPGEVTTIPFALAWDFPQVGFGNNQTVWMRHYTNFYGAQETATNDYIAGSYPGHQGFNIANDALANRDSALTDVHRWWDQVAYSTEYPRSVRTAALNTLYQMVFNCSFWEGGLVSNTVTPSGGVGKRIGTDIPGTHIFTTMDNTNGGTPFNESNVDGSSYMLYNLLFPTLERDFLRARWVQAGLMTSSGNTADPTLTGNPFITYGASGAPSPTDGLMDVPNKAIHRMHSYAVLNNDPEFLEYAYPEMKKLLTWIQGHIPAGAHLPTDPPGYGPNTYDVLFVEGFGIYNSELYLLSLESVIDAGQRLGEPQASIDAMQTELALAKEQFELLFWDPVNNYYRFATGGPYAAYNFLDAFYAQQVAQRVGLPDLVDPQHMLTQLRTHYDDFKGRDLAGNLIGFTNLPAGKSDGPETTEIWTGTNYLAAANYYAVGKRFNDDLLKSRGLEMASSVTQIAWNNDDPNGYAFQSPENWNDITQTPNTTSTYRYSGYARNKTIWQLIDAIKPLDLRAPTTTVLTSSASPSIFGQSVTFTATVSPAPAAGETVTFTDGQSTLRTAATDDSGTARFTTSALPVGSHVITAAYAGNDSLVGSDSPGLPQVVNKASTSTGPITSSSNPSQSGDPVTFWTTVAAVAPGGGTPTGIAEFLDGTTSLGTVTLVDGRASLSTSALAKGSHSITAVYRGDANFAGSDSSAAPLVQRVSKSRGSR